MQDSEAKVFVGAARFAAGLRVAPRRRSAVPATARFAVGSVARLPRYRRATVPGSPTRCPENRAAGQVMNYTSGTTGRPKGVRRPLTPFDPDMVFSMFAMFLGMFGVQPGNDNVHLTGSPLYHTAVLMFTGSSLHFGHTVVLMDKWTPESCLQAIQKYRVTTSHMVPTQFHRLLALPEEVKAKYDVSSLRHMIHAAAPCPIDVKRRMLEWWGPVIYEYYAASEGGGTLVTPEEWLAVSRAPSAAPGRARRSVCSTRAATTCRRGSRAPCTWRWAAPTSSTTRTRRRPRPTAATASSPSATSATSTRRATCFSATARST